MKTRKTVTADGIELTYYVVNGKKSESVTIFNAPGMSIKFWVPIIAELSKEYNVYAMEYRSYPDSIQLLDVEKCSLLHFSSDFAEILKKENVNRTHCLSWCLGAKIMLEFYKTYSNIVSSMMSMNSILQAITEQNRGNFSKLIYQMSKRLDDEPESIETILALMKQVGSIPSMDFLEMIKSEDPDSPALGLYNLLDDESSFSNLSFYLLDNEIGLKNYLTIYDEMCKVDYYDYVKKITVPFCLIYGEEDSMIRLNNKIKSDFSTEFARVKEIPEGTHFMLIEMPGVIRKEVTMFLQSQKM